MQQYYDPNNIADMFIKHKTDERSRESEFDRILDDMNKIPGGGSQDRRRGPQGPLARFRRNMWERRGKRRGYNQDDPRRDMAMYAMMANAQRPQPNQQLNQQPNQRPAPTNHSAFQDSLLPKALNYYLAGK